MISRRPQVSEWKILRPSSWGEKRNKLWIHSPLCRLLWASSLMPSQLRGDWNRQKSLWVFFPFSSCCSNPCSICLRTLWPAGKRENPLLTVLRLGSQIQTAERNSILYSYTSYSDSPPRLCVSFHHFLASCCFNFTQCSWKTLMRIRKCLPVIMSAKANYFTLA